MNLTNPFKLFTRFDWWCLGTYLAAMLALLVFFDPAMNWVRQ